MLHITNTEMSRSGVVLSATTATSPSNTATSTGFSLTQFEGELAAMVNEALEAAGVSPSAASFSFTPTSSASAATSSSSSPSSTSATSSTSSTSSGSTQSQPNGAAGNGQSNTTGDWINLPMVGEVNMAPLIAASTSSGTTPAPSTTPAIQVDLTDNTDPVVGTQGLIYDPKNGVFGGMGAAPITDANTLTNPITGKIASTDLVLDGYEKIYGSDSISLEGALMQNWGPPAVQAYLQANPGTSVATLQQQSQQTQSNFELYGPWTSFTDQATGVLSYFDANGVQYADGTGPASQMFTAVGTPNTAAWDSATGL